MPVAGLNRITDVALFVADLERAIAFYRDRMDLKVKRLDTGFAEFWMEGAVLALWEEADVRRALDFDGAPRRGPHAMVAIRLESSAAVDAAYAELVARGVAFRSPPQTYPWHAHAAYFSDPDDNLWEIYCWTGVPRTV
jgi:catechol 2,3-dioxygenase-like lactoylglutathione lyase family enzyme